jgi:uncharacterized membrane protein
VWSYLRRRFVAGFFVTVPLALSLAALVWIFGVADALTSPLVERVFGQRVPGLGIAATAAGILLVGFFAANVVGRRLLQRGEHYLMLVPLFRSIYAPVKQLVWAFNPQNDSGFKRVVLVEEPQRGMVLGFLTREPAGGLGGRLRAHQPSLPRRRPALQACARAFPGPVGGGRRAHLPDGRDGAAGGHRGDSARRRGAVRDDDRAGR